MDHSSKGPYRFIEVALLKEGRGAGYMGMGGIRVDERFGWEEVGVRFGWPNG